MYTLYGVKNETHINMTCTDCLQIAQSYKNPKSSFLRKMAWKSTKKKKVYKHEYGRCSSSSNRIAVQTEWNKWLIAPFRYNEQKKDPAPDNMLEFVSCSCNNKWARRACRCCKVQLHCNHLCDCLKCEKPTKWRWWKWSFSQSNSSDSCDINYQILVEHDLFSHYIMMY